MAFSQKSLTILNGEARISDKRVAEALGYTRVDNLHKAITRNREELASYGELHTMAEIPDGRGRPIINYLLTEEQAVLLCMFSRTKKAAQARKKIIRVFTAWRRGQELPSPQQPEHEPIAVLHERRTAITGLHGTYSAATIPASLISSLPVWPSGRRTYWWYDEEVREFVTRNHRQRIQKDVLEECIARYGVKRSPSKTGLNRYWIKLDRVFGNNNTRAVRNLEKSMGL